MCRLKFLSGIFFLPEKILLTFLPDKGFISSSCLKWRTVILDRWKPNQVKLTIAPAYCLEFSGHGTGRVMQQSLEVSVSLSARRPKWLSAENKAQRGKSCMENSRGVWRPPALQHRTSQHTCVKRQLKT